MGADNQLVVIPNTGNDCDVCKMPVDSVMFRLRVVWPNPEGHGNCLRRYLEEVVREMFKDYPLKEPIGQ